MDMSAPAGWYPQPDGRQRYWDGSAWTEHFHGDAQASSVTGEEPQASTPIESVPTYGQEQAYGGQPTSGQPTYGQPTYGQPTTYGQQPAYGTAPATTGKSGLGKGCLIAGIIGLVILGLVVALAVVVFNRAKSTIDDAIASATAAPSAPMLPSESAGAPDPGTSGGPLEQSAAIGKGFTLSSVTVADGWRVAKMDVLDMYTIEGMTANPAPTEEFVLFDLEFKNGSEVVDTTMCTGETGKTEITCLPLSKDVTQATEVVAKNTF
jgi:hypothetical protein